MKKRLVEKNVPTDPSKWSYYKSQAKEKFDVYPSAYANAWAAKQYKAAGGGWKTEEGVVNEAKNEPPVITQLRNVIRSGYKSVKDPKTGKNMKVDSYSASAIISVYDQLKKQENRDQFVNAGLMKMQTIAFKLLNKREGVIKENTAEDVIKDLDKVKNDLIKKVDVLIAKKKKLYSNVDIESPMSAEEKKLDKDIADLFSQIQQLVLQKRKMKKESVNEGNAFTGALFKARKEGLKEFEFGGKKYPVINEVDDDDEPSVSSVKKVGKGTEKQKKEMLSIQKKLKDNAKKTVEFTKIPQDDRTPAQKAHLKNMADLTTKLKKLKSLTEDIDVGHQDDEPNMLKADLFRIAKYAKELYELLGQFDNAEEEIDFPHWWQSDIVNAKTLMVNAKHYLNGELNVNGNPLGEVKKNLSEGLQYHIKNKKPISENIYRWGSTKFFKLVNECRTLWKKGEFIPMNESDEWFLDSDLGKVGIYEGKKVLLDFPILTEAEYQGEEVELNSPKRNSGEGKKYVVYVKDPQSGNIRKVTFGDVKGGLTAKISNPEARKAFSDRHNCPDKKDKTTPGYWSCNLPRHWSKIGGGEDINAYW